MKPPTVLTAPPTKLPPVLATSPTVPTTPTAAPRRSGETLGSASGPVTRTGTARLARLGWLVAVSTASPPRSSARSPPPHPATAKVTVSRPTDRPPARPPPHSKPVKMHYNQVLSAQNRLSNI